MAKKFSFRLEPVLKLKNQTVQLAKAELSVAIQARYSKELEIKQQNEYLSEINRKDYSGFKIQDFRNLYYHKNSVKQNLEKMESERTILVEKEKVKQGKFNLALQEEKSIIKLKEKQLELHKDILNKEEQKDLDEIAGRLKRNN